MNIEMPKHGKSKESIRKEIERLEERQRDLLERSEKLAQKSRDEGGLSPQDTTNLEALDAQIEGVEQELQYWEGELEKK